MDFWSAEKRFGVTISISHTNAKYFGDHPFNEDPQQYATIHNRRMDSTNNLMQITEMRIAAVVTENSTQDICILLQLKLLPLKHFYRKY